METTLSRSSVVNKELRNGEVGRKDVESRAVLGLPWWVQASSSKAGGASSIPGWGTKISQALWPKKKQKKQNRKQKQYYNKFYKDFFKKVYIEKNLFKKFKRRGVLFS